MLGTLEGFTIQVLIFVRHERCMDDSFARLSEADQQGYPCDMNRFAVA